jgi:hypothetical protein
MNDLLVILALIVGSNEKKSQKVCTTEMNVPRIQGVEKE